MRSQLLCLILLLTSCSVFPLFSDAQESSATESDAGLEAMQKLSALAGSWEGEGWMRRGPGEPHKMRSTEKVGFELDGRILVIHGLHFDKEDPEKVVHNAYAVVSHDRESGNYRFRSYLADGRQGDHEMKVEDGVIKWFMDSPRGKITYSITIENDVWKETGEMAGPNNQPFQFFGMELKKQK